MLKECRLYLISSLLLFVVLSSIKYHNFYLKPLNYNVISNSIPQESSLGFQIIETIKKLNSTKKKVRFKCYKSESQSNYGIPESINKTILTWFRKKNSPYFKRFPTYSVEYIKDRVNYSSKTPKFSKIEKIGNFLYKISNFCIEPRSHRGIILFKIGKKLNSNFKICTEYSCHPWTYSVLREAPPKDVQWISSASAVIPVFTGSNPWHTVHTLFPMAELFQHSEVNITRGNAHFFPVFSRLNFRDKFKRDYALGYHTFRFWPLVYASVPSNITLMHINLYENLSFPNITKSVPKLCYRTGYFGNLFLDKAKFKSGKFHSVSFKSTVDWYILNIVKWIDAESLSSDWCIQKRGRRGKPRMLMVFRNRRKICNMGKLINASMNLGFDVKVVRFEAMSLEDQIRSVRLSDVVFGMHGAGLTNVLWTQKGSVLIEIYPSDAPGITSGIDLNPTSNYGALAYMVGTRHVAYLDPSIPNLNLFWRQRDVNLDVGLFKLFAKDALEYVKKNRACNL